jgi:short-subunit dehydrogenase
MADKLAIVTGASTGIGFELAHCAAEDGYDLVVVADEPLIEAAAADFRRDGVTVTAVEADLSTLDGVDRLVHAAAGRRIDVLCANAGWSHGGPFMEQDFTTVRRTIDTNITGTMYLVQRVMKEMIAVRSGKVLVTGSIAGFIPGPYNAVYNATKAFIDSITEALRVELEKVDGVSLTTLMPGATETEFFDRADLRDTKAGQAPKDDPATVARAGWKAMQARERTIIPGLHNKVQVAGSGVVPKSVQAKLHAKLFAPGSGEEHAKD